MGNKLETKISDISIVDEQLSSFFYKQFVGDYDKDLEKKIEDLYYEIAGASANLSMFSICYDDEEESPKDKCRAVFGFTVTKPLNDSTKVFLDKHTKSGEYQTFNPPNTRFCRVNIQSDMDNFDQASEMAWDNIDKYIEKSEYKSLFGSEIPEIEIYDTETLSRLYLPVQNIEAFSLSSSKKVVK